jgi:hypothetical protein
LLFKRKLYPNEPVVAIHDGFVALESWIVENQGRRYHLVVHSKNPPHDRLRIVQTFTNLPNARRALLALANESVEFRAILVSQEVLEELKTNEHKND